MISLLMNGSVGERGKNSSADVYLIKALLNSYARNTKKAVLPMNGSVDAATLGLLEEFQKKVVRMAKPDRLVSVGGGTFKKLVEHLKTGFTVQSLTAPKKGLLTWVAEGHEGGLFHSRLLHVPSSNSGLTIGRGYDMKDKSSSLVASQLMKAGIGSTEAMKVAAGARLKGKAAKDFVIANDLLDFEVSPKTQLALFNIVYGEKEKTVLRICKKADTVAAYGFVNWGALPGSLLELFIDLTYRGDYSGTTRKFLQKPLAQGDIPALKLLFNDRSKWASVPYERFKARSKFAYSISNISPAQVTP
ncbi:MULTISPECIES: hypothetical protein [unclassified Agarivorans]|uniref:hypothetical protein n=1 Tax=unclassified Agarivorans TaxID=2636026 RepID=UPI003D7D9099